MMKRIKFLTTILASLLIASLSFTGCSDDDEMEEPSSIDLFAGTYVGKYRALIVDTDEDTVVVTTDAANNRITFASAILNTSFETVYNPETQRAEFENYDIDTLTFVFEGVVYYAYNVTVSSGYCEMRNNDTELYIRLNNTAITDHTLPPPLPEGSFNLGRVETPNNMQPI